MKTVVHFAVTSVPFRPTSACTGDRFGASLCLYSSRKTVIAAFVLGPNDVRATVDLKWRFDDGPTHRRCVCWTDGAHGIYLPDGREFLAPSKCAGECAVRVDDTVTLNFDLNAAREETYGFERDCGA